MLELEIAISESWDEESEIFIYGVEKLELEHSLVSLSKWESKFERPFLSSQDKTPEEILWYIEAMTISSNARPEVFAALTPDHIEQIKDYIGAKMTATTFNESKKPARGGETITAELIYYWMVAMQIPFECQHWHLNRLLTLVKVCSIKNTPQKKMTPQEVARRNRELNAKRRQQLGSSG